MAGRNFGPIPYGIWDWELFYCLGRSARGTALAILAVCSYRGRHSRNPRILGRAIAEDDRGALERDLNEMERRKFIRTWRVQDDQGLDRWILEIAGYHQIPGLPPDRRHKLPKVPEYPNAPTEPGSGPGGTGNGSNGDPDVASQGTLIADDGALQGKREKGSGTDPPNDPPEKGAPRKGWSEKASDNNNVAGLPRARPREEKRSRTPYGSGARERAPARQGPILDPLPDKALQQITDWQAEHTGRQLNHPHFRKKRYGAGFFGEHGTEDTARKWAECYRRGDRIFAMAIIGFWAWWDKEKRQEGRTSTYWPIDTCDAIEERFQACGGGTQIAALMAARGDA